MTQSIDIREHEGIVQTIIGRQFAWALKSNYAPSHGREDLEQAGRMGLFLASKSWNPSKGTWTTWAYWQVRCAIWDSIRKSAGCDAGSQFHVTGRTSTPDDEDGASYAETIPAPDADLEGTGPEFQDTWDRLTQGLRPRQLHVAREHLLRGRTLASVAKDEPIGVVTREAVRRLADRARDGMRRNARRAGLEVV